MVDMQHIQRIAARLGEAANAERVILFGSYARGEAGKHFDVDLLIIAESDLPRHKRTRGLKDLISPYVVGWDLLVYTPQEIEEGRRFRYSFVSNVLREGKIIYEHGKGRREAVDRESAA
ncbi:MAG: nucleotidyltransferase domain-containing protein [Candidatus Sumerlaeota bacterium]|nr:nucleotidyltransferase domain-containing protein [Candidatus Sumerlaeota bacterium]